MAPVTTLRNRLLRALPPDDLRLLKEQLQFISLRPGRMLHHARLPIEHVYFIESGIVSVLANTDEDNHGVEAWLTGCEGMAGVPAVLGMDSSPHRSMVQVEGTAWRMNAVELRHALSALPSLRPVLLRSVGGILVQAGQGAACNVRHTLPQRLARWLLMVQDRLGTSYLPLTHEIMSKMLGVRRASVTDAIHALAQADVIASERRLVRVLDRRKLEDLSCGCYCILKAEFDRAA